MSTAVDTTPKWPTDRCRVISITTAAPGWRLARTNGKRVSHEPIAAWALIQWPATESMPEHQDVSAMIGDADGTLFAAASEIEDDADDIRTLVCGPGFRCIVVKGRLVAVGEGE